ncbi:uncharacterized protein CTRU02_211234 [Colletotrichum truncatum]|uniref:Uncharacterized protein n=2 Tax=Colletotrichum truncatum TaxID=5467 RepID=A0ACC3YDT3_COLTU|nr:uncharacterized protein CTRU02_08404 [Colletotrichum truncatum]KAF6790275.1 hypothetical protein CTRU02_08404 [Colletotrichum truncatum]
MQLTVFVTALLASVASARTFVLYEHANYGGAWSTENRGNDGTCWNLNGKGDKTSSVGGDSGCTTFYRQVYYLNSFAFYITDAMNRERDCQGAQWQNRGSARTVPDFLNDHIWSFRNQC